MTKFLWTCESEVCVCGHHLTKNKTIELSIANILQPTCLDLLKKKMDLHSMHNLQDKIRRGGVTGN